MDHDELLEDEPIEAYCVRCRQTVAVEDPTPVWTSRGMPATRGECPVCGGQVFRMGKTEAHTGGVRPGAIQVGAGRSVKLPQETVYVNFAPADQEIARQIAEDLRKVGVACWLHEHEPEMVDWAGGVHPALKECARMVYVLSPAALEIEGVEAAWRFFRDKRKPVIIAQVAAADPPDPIRRSPRFDFESDFRTAFRQLVQALQ